MSLRSSVAGFCLAVLTPVAALACSIEIDDAYARASFPNAPVGAAFLTLTNTGTHDDRLIGFRTPIARRAELHTHIEDANGVMQMTEIAGGIALPAGESHRLMRGGDHLMLMGLTAPLEQGQNIPVTLVFEHSGEMTVDIPVDLKRKPAAHGHSGH